MKKALSLALALLLMLSLLTACGGNTPNGGSSTPTTPASDKDGTTGKPDDTLVFVRRAVEVPGATLDLSDDSIYFVIIDGVKLSLPDSTVQDFLNAGFNFENKDEDKNRMVEAGGSSATGYTLLMKSNTNQTINISAKNCTDKSIPLKDCTVTEVQFGTKTYFTGENSAGLDISVVCNLSAGSTEEDVVSVFGEGYSKMMYASQLNYMLINADAPRGFIFDKDASGNISNIIISRGVDE